MGINLHYLTSDWERVICNLACAPFDTAHSGLNISRKLHSVLEDWKIEKKMGLCVRDNAANMASAFNDENQEEYTFRLRAIGCMNHTLQVKHKTHAFT